MRILHLIDTLSFGGAQVILKHLFEQEKNVENLYLFALRKTEKTLEIKHQHVFISQNKNKYGFSPIRELKKFIAENKIECLHCHLPKSQMFGFYLKKRWFKDIKLIFHEHGDIFLNTRWLNLFFKQSQNLVDKFIAVSGSAQKLLVEYAQINPQKVKVLYNFVNPKDILISDEIGMQIKKQYKIPENTFVIGFAGRFAEVKGIIYLIEALKYLDFEFVAFIAGDGELRPEVEGLIKKFQLEDKVMLAGFVTNLNEIYNIFDCYVMPSHSEASPMVYYEAQNYGIPIIGSNVAAINEFVIDGKNGLLFDVKNSEQLAEKITKLYKNKELQQIFKKNAIEMVKKYSFSNFVEKLGNLYLTIE